jgi:hypothetical protein
MIWIGPIHEGAAKQLEAIWPDGRQHVLNDIAAFEEHKGQYRAISGRYRIIFKPVHPTSTADVGRPSPQRKDLPMTRFAGCLRSLGAHRLS